MGFSEKLKNKVVSLPDTTGVYIFKDREGGILYIGKAKSLKKRVQSYFNRELSLRTQAMVSKIADIEYRLISSEGQAQLLEASLIKEKQPQYNVDLKDDKSFPWIRITCEEFPVVSLCRIKKIERDDKSLYFGPYTNVKLLRQAFKLIRKIFGFRSCKKMPPKPCLYYRLKLCPACCIKKISAAGYKEIIDEIAMFLESKYEELIKRLTEKMKKSAEEKKFEEAQRARDQISALSAIGKSQGQPEFNAELEDLKSSLNLSKLPLRIEAFDISNISGKEACGSMVSFFKGVADKKNYRRFRIKTVESIDDYKMLREVIQRRYARLVKERLPLPDLVLVDGGRGHLEVARDEINKLDIEIPVVSIAKDREHIYLQDRQEPLKFTQDTAALNLLRRIRDEAHRFAISYHHLLRRKKIIGK